MCGDFKGPFDGEFLAGQFNGTFRLRGRTGGVKGIHIRGTFTEQGTPSIGLWDLDGTIRFPEHDDENDDDDDGEDADNSEVETEADLDGSQEVPSVATNMTGEVEIEIEDGELEFELEVSNNTHDIFAAHIHCAPPGVNGPVGVTLFTGSFTAESGTLAEGTIMAPNAGNGCGWADISAVAAAIQSGTPT